MVEFARLGCRFLAAWAAIVCSNVVFTVFGEQSRERKRREYGSLDQKIPAQRLVPGFLAMRLESVQRACFADDLPVQSPSPKSSSSLPTVPACSAPFCAIFVANFITKLNELAQYLILGSTKSKKRAISS